MALQCPMAFPRILIQVTYANIESCSPPYFEGEEANLINLCRNGNHRFRSHSSRHQRLMGVSERGVGDSYSGQQDHMRVVKVKTINVSYFNLALPIRHLQVAVTTEEAKGECLDASSEVGSLVS